MLTERLLEKLARNEEASLSNKTKSSYSNIFFSLKKEKERKKEQPLDAEQAISGNSFFTKWRGQVRTRRFFCKRDPHCSSCYLDVFHHHPSMFFSFHPWIIVLSASDSSRFITIVVVIPVWKKITGFLSMMKCEIVCIC